MSNYNYKMIPANTGATHAIVKYRGDFFAEVPLQFNLPCKEYIAVFYAIDKVFNEFNPEMKDLLLGEGTSGLLTAMRGELDEETSDEFVYQSPMMQEFTVELSFKIE